MQHYANKTHTHTHTHKHTPALPDGSSPDLLSWPERVQNRLQALNECVCVCVCVCVASAAVVFDPWSAYLLITHRCCQPQCARMSVCVCVYMLVYTVGKHLEEFTGQFLLCVCVCVCLCDSSIGKFLVPPRCVGVHRPCLTSDLVLFHLLEQGNLQYDFFTVDMWTHVQTGFMHQNSKTAPFSAAVSCHFSVRASIFSLLFCLLSVFTPTEEVK